MIRKLILFAFSFIFLMFCGFNTSAQYLSEYMQKLSIEHPNVQYDATFNSSIRTVQFLKGAVPNSPPILELNSNQFLSLTFDDLGNKSIKNYQFTIQLCNADWTVSNVYRSDYINGLFQEYVLYDSVSIGTYQPYVHYRIDLPSRNMSPRISGNYLIKVFLNDPSKPILQRRFYVYEQAVGVRAVAKRPNYSRYRDAYQQVNFTINTRNLMIMDPYHDLKVIIKQNWRWDNEIRDLKPLFIQDTSLSYEYDEGNLFKGVNEFRYFDTRDFRFKGVGVKYYTYDSLYNAWLYPDDDRSINTWTNYPDYNGGYLIATHNTPNPATDADYIWVHFKLRPSYRQDPEDKVYIFGALTDWKINDQFMLKYDESDRIYKLDAKLKQGIYNYWYVVVNSKGEIDATLYEGSHWETENSYTILVYYKLPSMQSDRLIGISIVNTLGKQ